MKYLGVIITTILVISCSQSAEQPIEENRDNQELELISNKIKVLNFATFHMGYTSDAHSIEFDENDEKNIAAVREVASRLSAFKPTVIVVETIPSYNETLRSNYAAYVKDSTTSFENQDEVELLAFEVGRLSNTKRIYGIDHKLAYNYDVNSDLSNKIDSLTYNEFISNPFASIPELNFQDVGMPLKERLRNINHQKVLDILITGNADMLAFVGSEQGFEGADEAAKYYQRNLRIYSNLNRIPLTQEDRVFILSGGSHTAFLNEFMKRSPKYEVVETYDYLD